MAEKLSPEEAAARLQRTDTLGIPLGTGQPPAFMEALGERDDWEELRVYGALLAVGTALFNHDGVHYLSGFFGPIERAIRDAGANISFAPADFRRFEPLLREQRPRVVATAAAPPDEDGWCSLSLHAGASVGELHRAGADPERVLVVETSERFPRTFGLAPEHPHAVHVDEADLLIATDREPFPIVDPPPSEVDRAIAEHARVFIPEGATLQTGIGTVPSTIAGLLAEGDGGDYGVHSEMFTTGLMHLHEAGKVSNRKGQFDGVSVATFAGGTPELYRWLHGNHDVAFLPLDVRALRGHPGAGGRGHDPRRPVLGHRRPRGLHRRPRPLARGKGPAMPAVDGRRRGRGDLPDRPWFDAGAVITTPRHQVDVIVTEYGAAELQGKTIHQRGQALAAVAHPEFRDGLLEAAERASGGRAPF